MTSSFKTFKNHRISNCWCSKLLQLRIRPETADLKLDVNSIQLKFTYVSNMTFCAEIALRDTRFCDGSRAGSSEFSS